MVLRRRKCKDCGFLCINSGGAGHTHIIEYSPKERVEGIEYVERGFAMPKCYRRNISFETELKTLLDNCPTERSDFGEFSYSKEALTALLSELITTSRRCTLFTPYIPGYNPELHLSKWETDARERSNRRWNVFYFLLGIASTVIGGILVNLFISQNTP